MACCKKFKLCGLTVRLSGVWPFVWAVILAVPLVIIASIITATYQKQYKDSLASAPSVCNFMNFTVASDQCSTQICYGAGNNERCSTHYYDCFWPVWTVNYTTEGGNLHETSYSNSKKESSEDLAMERGNQMIGTRECWYDRLNPDRIHLSEPDPTASMIAMIVFWVLISMCFVAAIVIFVIRRCASWRRKAVSSSKPLINNYGRGGNQAEGPSTDQVL